MKRSTLSRLTLLLSCYSTMLFAAETADVKIEGISDKNVYENVRIYVNSVNRAEAANMERYQALLSDAIDKALRAEGYYNSTISYRSDGANLIADVKMGVEVKIAATDVNILGQAAGDPDFQALEKQEPKPGTRLNHGTYENFKSELSTLALKQGYFDAEFLVNRLEVMPSTAQAWWRLVFDSGDRYRYGNITFKHAQIREDYLRNMLKIKSGEPYYINDLSTLTSDFSSSNWFSSVLIQPQLNEQAKTVDLDVSLYPRKKNSMDVGIGYSSDVGPRFQLSWEKPWINSRGQSFHSNLYVSAPKQTVEAKYKIPLLKNPLNYYYEIGAGLENEDHNDTKSLAATVAALRYWNHPTGWQYSLGLQARYDSFTQAGYSTNTLLLYPTASVSRTRLRGGLFPTWGDAQRLSVDLGRKLWLSDVDFLSTRASTAWIRTLGENHRFYLRGEIGWLHTNDLERIPPALRFFAGGDRSVRGYGYKKISPKDANGKLIGGSRLATGTVEYQYQVYPNWWWATFVDTGLAANSFSVDELRYGAGMGLRWASPIGAIKFDIATPIHDKDNSKNIQFYIGLGSEL